MTTFLPSFKALYLCPWIIKKGATSGRLKIGSRAWFYSSTPSKLCWVVGFGLGLLWLTAVLHGRLGVIGVPFDC
jgi:hypothetical protein